MLTGIAFLLVVATVPLFGGNLALLARVRPNRVWTLFASLGLQFGVFTMFSTQIPEDLGRVAHLASYGFALIFVHANWRIPGMLVLVSGGLMNLAAIAANGGLMPASASALAGAGHIESEEEFKNSTEVAGAKLQFLGDIFYIPDGVPFANVFSIGDLVLVLGGGILAHTVCGSRIRPRRNRLRLAVDDAPRLHGMLGELRNAHPKAGVPQQVDLVAGFDVVVQRTMFQPVLHVGSGLLAFASESELRALTVRAAVRHSFGANAAFDLADEHELEATELAGRYEDELALSYALVLLESLTEGVSGFEGLLSLLDSNHRASGLSLRDHLSVLNIDPGQTAAEIDSYWAGRPDGATAQGLLRPATSKQRAQLRARQP